MVYIRNFGCSKITVQNRSFGGSKITVHNRSFGRSTTFNHRNFGGSKITHHNRTLDGLKLQPTALILDSPIRCCSKFADKCRPFG